MVASLKLNFSVKNQGELKKRFEDVTQKNPHIRINVFSGNDKITIKECIKINLLYLYDAQKHGSRKFESSGCCWLIRLTIQEVAFFNSLAVELAGEEFSVELDEVNMGIFSYCLVPKKLSSV